MTKLQYIKEIKTHGNERTFDEVTKVIKKVERRVPALIKAGSTEAQAVEALGPVIDLFETPVVIKKQPVEVKKDVVETYYEKAQKLTKNKWVDNLSVEKIATIVIDITLVVSWIGFVIVLSKTMGAIIGSIIFTEFNITLSLLVELSILGLGLLIWILVNVMIASLKRLVRQLVNNETLSKDRFITLGIMLLVFLFTIIVLNNVLDYLYYYDAPFNGSDFIF